jgi:integrative and conjugative element protein (TIGR02256 family)
MTEYFVLGEVLEAPQESDLYRETAALLRACRESSYVDIRELRCDASELSRTEYIIIDAGDGSVDAGNPGGIRRQERLAISVNPQCRIPILVHALRKDFPPLSHQYPKTSGQPRTLCLYDHDWSAVQISWTPERFIGRIFWWLRESAQLKLHRDDQPLEQLFVMSPFQLILPSNFADYTPASRKSLIIGRVGEGHSTILRAIPPSHESQSKAIQVVCIEVHPVDSTTVVELPETLGGLQDQLESWGSDLLEPLYECVFEAISEGVMPLQENGEGILILLWIPRTRKSEMERVDVLGFMMTASLYKLAEAFDMLGLPEANGLRRRIALVGGNKGTGWRSFTPLPVEVRSALTPDVARDLSGVTAESAEFDGVLAGVGSLGSALADIWVRQQWGRWTFVDPDQLMPHNLSRHIAFDWYIGRDKTNTMRDIATLIYPNEPPPDAIPKSIMSQDEDVLAALSKAQLAIDVTTSLQAPRGLARTDTAPRTASLFMTPSGLSSVMILEDEARLLRLDGLEGQYYRALIASDWGREHLANHSGDRWVGGGCRDISVRISNEYIHIHAGILSRQLRMSVKKPDARLCVWTYDEQTGAISSHEIALSNVHTTRSNGWIIKYDSALMEKLKQARIAALPNETGGSIIGFIDLKARTIVIVDVLPTPSDSQCSPSHFIRGEDEQEEALNEVHSRTASIVDYLGEWHSHPEGAPAHPSEDDEKLLNTLQNKMGVEGLPALMVIVARNETTFIVRYEEAE